jgi:hypothetical protein
LHRGFDRILVFDVFLDRVGIVKAQMADTAVFAGEAEVQADGFGVANVQIAVGLRRKAGLHSSAVFVGLQILQNDVADEVGWACGRLVWFCRGGFSVWSWC